MEINNIYLRRVGFHQPERKTAGAGYQAIPTWSRGQPGKWIDSIVYRERIKAPGADQWDICTEGDIITFEISKNFDSFTKKLGPFVIDYDKINL